MNRQSSRNLVILVVSLAVLALLGYLAYNLVQKRSTGGLPVSSYEVQQIPKERLPDRFPLDLPIPENAYVTKNEIVSAPDGRMQETRAYISPRALGDERAAYAAYFATGGWELRDVKELPAFASFLAERGGVSIQVTMNTQGAGTAVSINATLAPAKSR